MTLNTYNIGDRVAVNDYVGTIRYKGPVKNSKGEYYGVEWDVASRGKHNGTHGGEVYFCTSDGENSASFIKEKLITPAVSCMEAIKNKYGQVEDGNTGIDESEAYLSQTGHSRVINIEVVGMKKIGDLQSQFDMLRIVNIANMCVVGESHSADLGTFVPRVDELHLSHNLLTSWRSVGDVIRHMQRLECLDLSGNRLRYDERERDSLEADFIKIKQLNLADMNMTWEEVMLCSQLWLQVTELHLCKNRINEISTSPHFNSLNILNLASNPLRSWSNIKPLAHLPKLEKLLVSDCQLCDVSVEDGDFPSLIALAIQDNHISEWKHIGTLNRLARLTELMFTKNPVLEVTDQETNRQLAIAKILQLIKYNQTDIVAKERRGAEIDYTKRFGEEWIQTGASFELTEANAHFYAQHPTYLNLIKKWGAPEKTEVKQSKPKSAIKESLIEVTFVDLVTESGKKVTKYIPHTMNVLKCRNLAMKLLNVKGNNEEYDFEYDLRQLSFYGVQHGDEILLRQIP